MDINGYNGFKKTANMKFRKIDKRIIISISLFLLVFYLNAQNKLVISQTEGDWLGQKIALSVLEYAYEAAGVEISVESYPALRSLVNADIGITDGVMVRMSGLEASYTNLIRIKIPVSFIELMVYTRDVFFNVEGWESLSPYKITFMLGNQLVMEHTAGMKFETVSTPELAFKKLLLGRTDLVIEAREYNCIYEDMDVLGIQMLEPPLVRIPTYHYLNKRHVLLIPVLESVLKNMNDNGEIERIMNAVVKEYKSDCLK